MIDKEIVKKVNLECAIKSKPTKKLKGILNNYDEKWLSDYYYIITKNIITDTKKNLIKKIYNELTDENVIHNFLYIIKENEYQELIKIIRNNGQIQDDYIDNNDYCYLKCFGILYTFNYQEKLHIIIPDEIMNVLKNMNLNIYHKKTIENSKLVDLAYSMLNLYGVVPLNAYLNACNKYYSYKDVKEIDLDCLFIPEREINIKAIQNENENENDIYIVKDDHLDDCDEYIIHKIITRLEDDLFEFDFKEISLDDLLKYQKLYYYEKTDEVIKFKEYLRNNNLNDKNIDLLISSIILSFRRDYIEGILFLNETFEEESIKFNADNFEEIMIYIYHIIDNIPVWGNKGWTNKEIILKKCYD